jgi:hypothetical protein
MNKNFSVSKNNNIIFGTVFFIFFLVIGFYSSLTGEKSSIRLWSILISLLFLIITIIKPNLFTLPNRLWIRLGILFGKFMSPIIMFMVFFFIVTPTGILIRIFGKDVMGLKRGAPSYWINRDDKAQSMKKQF